MTLRHFQIFISVCDEQGMTQAARQLHISQPSISQAVKELEEHYQVRLFERLGKKLFLTPAGQELLHYARHIISLSAQTEKTLRSFSLAAPIRLGATLSIGESIFIDIITRLKKAMPEQEVYSHVHNTAALEDALLRDELDAALVEGSITSAYLTQIPFLEDELIFIISPALLPPEGFTREQLTELPFILREKGSGTHNLFEHVMNQHHLQCHVTGSYNNTESIRQAVAAGLGISAISSRLVAKELQEGKLASFTIPGITFRRSFRIVYHKNKYLTAGLKTFIDLCKSYI